MKTADLYILHERFLEFSALCMYENVRRVPFATRREKGIDRIDNAGMIATSLSAEPGNHRATETSFAPREDVLLQSERRVFREVIYVPILNTDRHFCETRPRQAAKTLTTTPLLPDRPIARLVRFATAAKQTHGKLQRL